MKWPSRTSLHHFVNHLFIKYCKDVKIVIERETVLHEFESL